MDDEGQKKIDAIRGDLWTTERETEEMGMLGVAILARTTAHSRRVCLQFLQHQVVPRHPCL